MHDELDDVLALLRAANSVERQIDRRVIAALIEEAGHPALLERHDELLPRPVAGRIGPERFFLAPMVFWLNDSDAAIQAVCWAGAGLSLLLVVNLLPRLCLFLLFALYLSLTYAGQAFMTYQWDTYLLETGFAALLLSFATTPGISD